MGIVGFEKWISLLSFRAHFDDLGERGLVIDKAGDPPLGQFTCCVESGNGSVEIGVIASGMGPKPSAILVDRSRVLVVGHDDWLHWVEINALSVVSERRLGGIFFEFLHIDADAIVLHELGALRLDAKGAIVWKIDTGIVENHRIDSAGNLVLSVVDESAPITIAVDSGKAAR